MNKHEHHNECKHKRVSYCQHCDVVYCEKCGREWYKQKWSYVYPYTYPCDTGSYPITSTVTTTNDHTECAISSSYVMIDSVDARRG